MVHFSHQDFLTHLPKAELHVHIEGTLEPPLLMQIAQRNGMDVPSGILDPTNSHYVFTEKASFIDTYIKITTVLQTEYDYYDMMVAYLKKATSQRVLHTEVFFDLQSHARRGIRPEPIIDGLYAGLEFGKKNLGITGGLIMCLLRETSEQDALKTLHKCVAHKDKIMGIGLASLEDGNPASKFIHAFKYAREQGFHVVAHAGESDIRNIKSSIEELHVERVDHGVQCAQDSHLMRFLAQKKIPLTVCPLSNVVLRIIDNIEAHPIKKMIDAGLIVTINSDDPAFFGGYIAENYVAAVNSCGLSLDDAIQCARNSFTASFASEERKQECLKVLEEYVQLTLE